MQLWEYWLSTLAANVKISFSAFNPVLILALTSKAILDRTCSQGILDQNICLGQPV